MTSTTMDLELTECERQEPIDDIEPWFNIHGAFLWTPVGGLMWFGIFRWMGWT